MTGEQNNNTAPVRKAEVEVEEGPFLEWTTHPVKRRPWTAISVALFIFAVSFVVLVATESQWFGFVALVVLFASVAKFYMPTKFRLTEKEVIIKSTTQTIKKPWSMFRSFYPDKNGVLLSPFMEPSRLENFRGLYLIFGDNRDEVMTYVRTQIEKLRQGSEGETS